MSTQAERSAYCVLTADVVRSRARIDPARLQAALEDAAAVLGERYAEPLATALTIASGDELQALLCRPDRAFDLAFDLADRLHPLQLRFGVGLGDLSTPLRPTTGSMGGSAFYRAREAIEAARRTGRHIVFRGFGDLGATLDVLGDCAAAIAAGWTTAQRESVRAYLEHGSHQAAADALGRDRSTITRNLQRALAAQAVRCRDHLRELLTRAGETMNEEGRVDEGDR